MFTTKKIAVVSVINDLVTDNRVNKTCGVLAEAGYDVILIGRQLPDSMPLPAWRFKAVRMRLLFKKGPAFYFFFNLRLFFKLLFTKCDLLFANDLDTLWPNYVVSKWKRIPLVYDSHEIFCDVPELMHSPFKRRIWQSIEKKIVPRLKTCITVNHSIATIFEQKYKVKFHVIRNIPDQAAGQPLTRKELHLPEDKRIILLQGAGINVDRGAEELVSAMRFVENALLLVIGGGDVWPVLEEMVAKMKLDGKVRLIRKIPRADLVNYTRNADLGISIDKNTNPNYYNSLPNKIFDYIQCGVPVLATRLPEIERIISHYKVGVFIDSHDPTHIADTINRLFSSALLNEFKNNTSIPARELNWNTEKQKYLEIIKQVSH
ncbi:MAG: glycosyl transferase group 1 [Bacteroidetes bacterium]|nr:glycosyl transferase group 1 [Bacteroidota bacterium]